MAQYSWRTPLARAAFEGSPALETALADPRVDPMACNCEALRAACAGGHLPAVERLLGLEEVDLAALPGDHVDCMPGSDGPPLTLAARHGHLPVVERLQEQESKRDSKMLAPN